MTAAARLFGAGRFAGVEHMPGRRSLSAPAKADRSPRHRQLLAKVQIAKRDLEKQGFTDDDYRAVLIRIAKVPSSTKCTEAQLVAVLEEFKAKGWQEARPAGKAKPRAADNPMATKARALWISLYHLGVVRNPKDQALEGFARRQLKCERMQWADQSLGYRLIEALKDMAEVAGWSQDLAGVAPVNAVRVLKLRLVERIFERLREGGLVHDGWDWARATFAFSGLDLRARPIATWSLEDLDKVAAALGATLRTPVKPIGADEEIG